MMSPKMQLVFWMMVVALMGGLIATDYESRRWVLTAGGYDFSEEAALSPARTTISIDPNGTISIDPNAIRNLVKSGAICEVVGHCWRTDAEDGIWNLTGDESGRHFDLNTMYRRCALCGKEQSRRTDNWK